MNSEQDTFTQRMLQRAASVRNNREGSPRFNSDGSRRRESILQAIGDAPVKIVDDADFHIDNDNGAGLSLTQIDANNGMFAEDESPARALRRTNLRSSDTSISRNGVSAINRRSKSQSTSSNLIAKSKGNFHCKDRQDLCKMSSNGYADLEQRIAHFERISSENKNEKEKSCEDDEKRDSYNKKNDGNYRKYNSLDSSSYMPGFELGNVKWRGPLYAASVASKNDKNRNFDTRKFEVDDEIPPFLTVACIPQEPELVKAIHTRIPAPPKMRVEVKEIGNFKKPEIFSGSNFGEKNHSGDHQNSEGLSLVVNTIGIEKLEEIGNGKFETISEHSDSPTTPLTAEIRRLDADIKRLELVPGVSFSSENGVELSPPTRIYPNLSKIHFTSTGYTPRKLYRSPTSPENDSELLPQSNDEPEILSDVKNKWNFDRNINGEIKMENLNMISNNETIGEIKSNGFVFKADIETPSRYVEGKIEAGSNGKFKPNMESTRKSSMTDLSKNTGSPCTLRESTVSSVTMPPDTPESIMTENALKSLSISPNEKNVTLESTIPYNIDNFLTDALGDELYNTTMTFPPSESNEKSISQFNASEIISEDRTPLKKKNKKFAKKETRSNPQNSTTFERTRTIYKSFTTRIKDRLRPGLKSVPKSVPNNDSTMTAEGGYKDNKRIQELLQEADIQRILMYQANKALNFCRSMKQFASSTEQVESEKSLLVAGLRKAAALEEINKLCCELNNNGDNLESCERGEVLIKNIILPLNKDILNYEAETGDFVQWFVIAVCQGTKVFATQAVSCPVKCPRIIFNGEFLIPDLPPNFKITVRVYSLKMRRATYNYDDKYHLNKTEKHSTCPSPKNFIRKKSDRSLSPKDVRPIELSAIKDTSFTLSGMVELHLHDLSLSAPWPLSSLVPGSVLQGTIDLSLSCKLHLSVSHAGFLTHGDEIGGFASWNRRWCVLQGQTLKFWNYPCDQEDKDPLAIIDLTNCISPEIKSVDRSMCAKPKTLLIETVRQRGISDKDGMLLECRLSCTIVRNLLCCDTSKDFSQWKSKLNHVVSALRDWNITNRSPDIQVSDL